MKRIDWSNIRESLDTTRRSFHAKYFAMYSHGLGGIVTDPMLMQVPVDDHLVHRGDGVFETFKCVDGALFNMRAHLDRLRRSAHGLGQRLALDGADLEHAIVETIRAAANRNCTVRILVSRGPGGFSVNPYECPEPGLYIIVTALGTPFMEEHPNGARVGRSSLPAKEGLFAEMKSCNYLQNVLMKKEAVERKLDFVASFSARGFLAEGATENFGIVSEDNRLLFPRLEGILEGTTMRRVMQLADDAPGEGLISGVDHADITEADIYSARELLIVGTTIDVTCASAYEGQPLAGAQGAVFKALQQRLLADIRGNDALRIMVF